MKTYLIKYYTTESAYRMGLSSYQERVTGERTFVYKWAQNKLSHSQFSYFEIVEC
ncbi:MAG: hypothetical protein J6C93_06630 [Clostridia bacterium]|nr:hypothetical protein [Clostridia bacterium]